MIEHIDIINLSHYDLGFTDHPVVCREMQSRYLDAAIDLVRASRSKEWGERFYWTCEANNAVLEWWQSASPARRDLLVELVQAGLVEVCAMPFNHGPTMGARQWACCAHWLPEELWQAFRPRTAVQNDVNGFPRAGVMALLDVGVEFLWMGLNCDTGGSPVPQPSAFWWEMPDGRRIFLWNSVSYPDGYLLFEASEWRRGPLPLVADTRYRAPRRGDILDPSPENLRRAHAICRARIETWRSQGYILDRVAVSMTNLWRIDNDPPCAQLPEFVAAWNAAGLKPSLALTTPTPALQAIEAMAGNDIPILQGEWTNWWANGAASTPHELAASRRAKRLVKALDSPLYLRSAGTIQLADTCTRHLCFFDEHTWGSWNSAAMPTSLDTRGQFADKAAFAYRPLAMAELGVGDANRAIAPQTRGIHIVNPYAQPFSGWVILTDDCLREHYEGVEDTTTGQELAFGRMPGVSPFLTRPTGVQQFSSVDTGKVFPDRIEGKCLYLWIDRLGPHEMRSFRLRERVGPQANPPAPETRTDDLGWPVWARWPETELFTESIGDFISLGFQGLAPRWQYKDILAQPSEAKRRQARNDHAAFTPAQPVGPAVVRDTGPTLVYEQHLSHPRLRWLRRTLEVYKACPRVRLEVALNRLSKPEGAEVFYVRFPLHCPGYDLQVTNGGLPFRPGQEQMTNTCQDYYAIDGQVTYTKNGSQVVLDCHDNALVAIGGMNDGVMQESLGEDLNVAFAILYNNVWYTNFAGDEAGVMSFSFDLYSTALGAGYAPQAFAVVNV